MSLKGHLEVGWCPDSIWQRLGVANLEKNVAVKERLQQRQNLVTQDLSDLLAPRSPPTCNIRVGPATNPATDIEAFGWWNLPAPRHGPYRREIHRVAMHCGERTGSEVVFKVPDRFADHPHFEDATARLAPRVVPQLDECPVVVAENLVERVARFPVARSPHESRDVLADKAIQLCRHAYPPDDAERSARPHRLCMARRCASRIGSAPARLSAGEDRKSTRLNSSH